MGLCQPKVQMWDCVNPKFKCETVEKILPLHKLNRFALQDYGLCKFDG